MGGMRVETRDPRLKHPCRIKILAGLGGIAVLTRYKFSFSYLIPAVL